MPCSAYGTWAFHKIASTRSSRQGPIPGPSIGRRRQMGDVIEKNVINGQRVMAGDELYRIADHTSVWVIADVAESDIAEIEVGMPLTVTLRAMATEPVEGKVTFIYPELNAETRTVPVRIELPNPGERMKPAMYADVMFQTGNREANVTGVPDSALMIADSTGRIDSERRRSLRAASRKNRPPRWRLCRGD